MAHEPSKRPNILLIQTDQQSWNTLGLYGNPVVKTPTIEALGDGGVVFEQAYCNYPACSPSRSSMMTGRFASVIRCQANHMHLDPREVTLPGVLRANGYRTALIGKNHAFQESPNTLYPNAPADDSPVVQPGITENPSELERHFDEVLLAGHTWMQGMDQDPGLRASLQHAAGPSWESQHAASVNPSPTEDSITCHLVNAAVEYVEASACADAPFFLWLSFPDPHTPYQVSEPYASLYDRETIPSPIKDSLDNKPEAQRLASLLDHNDRFDEAHFRELRAIHYGMIRQIDDHLGRVFAALRAQDIMEDTLVVFTSDHGDAMGDHGLIQKHNFFYDAFTRVPFLLSWPGQIVPRRTEQLVELVDVMPTLIDFAGIPLPPGLQGQSLRPFLTGASAQTKDSLYLESGESGCGLALSDLRDADGNLIEKGTDFAWCAFREAWFGRGRALRTARWKLALYETGEGELYDMESDPDECINRFDDPQYAAIRAELMHQLCLRQMCASDPLPLNTTVDPSLHWRNRAPER